MMDRRDLPVHQSIIALHGAAPVVTNALVTKADAKRGHLGREVLEHFIAHPSFLGRAWPGRNDHVRRIERLNFLNRDFIVTKNLHLNARHDLAKALNKVVGK